MCLGIPGQILEITDAENSMAKVDVSGVRREVNIACIIDDDHTVEECVGDWVLVHVGFAMSRIDEDEARQTLAILSELGEVQAELPSGELESGARDRHGNRQDTLDRLRRQGYSCVTTKTYDIGYAVPAVPRPRRKRTP